MNILLFNVPSRRGVLELPLGLLYVGAIIERCGHKAKILDLYQDDAEVRDFDSGHFDRIFRTIEEYEPSVIGYGGIATSYGRAKRLFQQIKSRYPGIVQIAGGPLASVYELLLTRARIDVVFHGETEISLPFFLQRLEQKEPVYDTPGISYLFNGKIMQNDPAEQIEDIDTIPFPAYHLLDVHRYLVPIQRWFDTYKLLLSTNPHRDEILKTIGTKSKYLYMVTARGCTHRCSFCYRHVHGVRQHSVDYVIKHIKYLKEKYGVDGIEFIDELFNSRPEWVMELCDAIEKNNLGIFYLVAGARVDKINEKMLRRLKDTGCIEINYGQESGSDTILKEYRKGVTSQKNREITLLTREVGINNPVQIVIGSPGETTSTIYETIQFLKDVYAYQYSLNYLIPLPGTPIWRYVQDNGLIQDVEKYLGLVADYGGSPLVNLTKEPDKVWRNWATLIHTELKLNHYKKSHPRFYYLYKLLFRPINTLWPLVPDKIKALTPKWLRQRF